MWTCIPSLLGAGLFPYWLGSFAYPRRSKNERNAVTGAICHDERFWVLVGSSATRQWLRSDFGPLRMMWVGKRGVRFGLPVIREEPAVHPKSRNGLYRLMGLR